MSSVTARPSTGQASAPTGPVERAEPRTRHWWPPLTMLGVVLAGVLAPLLRTPTFYYWDDTAAASVGAWRNIGDALLDGRLLLLDIEAWRGGNYAAEAAYGVFNPLLLGLYAGTHGIDDLVVVTVVIKAVFFLVMALGTYLLCREYGARPWPAALLGSTVPLSGFTLWMDGAAWVTGLTVTALTPWVWYTAKRAATGRGWYATAVLAGYLCASAGNPYGLLAAGFVYAALVVELLLRPGPRRALGLALTGATVALLAVPTYLPFMLTASVSYRAGSSLANDEILSPGLTDLVALSSPSFQPYMWAFDFPFFQVPVLYLGWFLLPLAPWFRWRELRRRAGELTAPYLVAGVYLLLVLGPSQVWFFRWPLRLLPYLWLALAVLVAVLLSAGLERSRPAFRGTLSGIAIFAGFWLAWADRPEEWVRHLVAAVLVAVLLGVTLRAARRSGRALALAAMTGTIVMLVVQLSWMPSNTNMTDFAFPRSDAALDETFADYRPGLTVQVGRLPAPEQRSADGAYEDLLFGSMYAVAGVESPTAYSGVGFIAFDVPLCTEYQGAMCPEAWDTLWERPDGSEEILADLIRAETVVVERSELDTRDLPAPEGWELAESTEYADIWRRTDPLPWPEGRLSDTTGPVTVTADQRVGTVDETLTVQRTGTDSAELTFARLAWPGYTAELDGQSVPTGQGPNGLLTVELPQDTDGGTLTLSWSPPGSMLSLAAAAAGLLAAAGLTAWEVTARRGGRARNAAAARPAAEETPA